MANCHLVVGSVEDGVFALTDRSILYPGILGHSRDARVLSPDAAVDVYPVVVFLSERVVLIVVVTVLVLDVVDLFEPLLGLLCRVPSQRALHGQVGVPALGAVGDKLLEAIFLYWYFGHCWHRLTLPLVEVD